MIRIVEGIEGARAATGAVVVIDVLRAFTTAAFAFAAGIEEIEIVATVGEALARPGFRMGEVDGKLIPGFDHNNSPAGLVGRRLSGRAILRTGAGAQCAVAARNAETLWLAALVNASATAGAIRGDATLVVSGAPDEGEEDRACALVIEAILRGDPPPIGEAIRMVRESRAARRHDGSDPDRPPADLDLACDADRFPFVMRGEWANGRLIARRSP
jgi:2-phosphosulfolactate phosphatase